MKKTLFCAGILVLAYLIGACTRVGHIQRTEPVRTMTFAGSHTAVAQCVQQRLGAKLQTEGFDRLVVYNSMKGGRAEGVSHYSITIGKAGEKGGFAEWRIVAPQSSDRYGPAAPGGVSASAVQELWKPVEDCAAQVKTS